MLLVNDRYLYGKSIILDEMYPVLKFLKYATGREKGMKCELCGRRTIEDAASVVTIKLEELVTAAEIGDALTLIVCYDCVPTLVEWLKNGIKKASTIRRRTDVLIDI